MTVSHLGEKSSTIDGDISNYWNKTTAFHIFPLNCNLHLCLYTAMSFFCFKIFLVHHLRLSVHKVQRSRIHWAHQIHSKELCYKGSNKGDLLQWLQCFWGLALSNCNQLLVECHKIFQFLLEDGILYIKDCREDPGSCLVGLQKNSTNQKTEQTILLYTLNETKFSHMIPVVAQSTVHIPQMISSNLHDIKQQIYTGNSALIFCQTRVQILTIELRTKTGTSKAQLTSMITCMSNFLVSRPIPS